jgi:hypothetical protein
VNSSTDSIVSTTTGTIAEAKTTKSPLGHSHGHGPHTMHSGGHCKA